MTVHETETKLLPYLESEFVWARHRPTPDWTPIPAVGDDVLYRHDYWEDPVPATVTAVQSLDDLDDPNLWRVVTGADGKPEQVAEGNYAIVAVADPWPLLTLRVAGRLGTVETREARLRGSPGWLPLDWETRRRPAPTVRVLRPPPTP